MKKNKILIVDDNKLNRQSLADIFRKAYQIVESEDGKKALEYLKKDKGLSVAAIILDLIMPVMDGFAFLLKAVRVSLLLKMAKQKFSLWNLALLNRLHSGQLL